MTTPEIEELKRLIEKKYGKQLCTTTDFEEFTMALKKVGIIVSASTMKRLYGYVGDSHKPRVATLDQLANYIGHRSFAAFVEWLKTSTRYNSSFFNARQLVSATLQEGDAVEIGWAPNRQLILTYLGHSAFRVEESRNSKMQVGDEFVTGCFILGQPLFLPYILRGNERTSPFVAGRNGGLTVARELRKSEERRVKNKE